MDKNIKLVFPGVPTSKQSARFRVQRFGNKVGIKSYQKQEVIDKEQSLAMMALSQLPSGYIPTEEALGVRVLFVFPPLAGWSKKKKKALSEGATFYKITKPDLTDNLMKGLFDALEGIVYINDSRIAESSAKKIYGVKPRTEVEFYLLKE